MQAFDSDKFELFMGRNIPNVQPAFKKVERCGQIVKEEMKKTKQKTFCTFIF